MLRPFLLIGVGGSGGKTLRIVRHELERRLSDVAWDDRFPSGWRFLHIDIPSIADGDDPDLPGQLPRTEYAGLVTAGVNYRNIDGALAGQGRTKEGDAIAGWRPDPTQVNVPVEKGAGQFRALGRIIALSNLKAAKAHLDAALRDINGRDVTAQLQDLTRRFGGTPSSVARTPVAIVVSSLAGGSGAGIVIDVCDLLRASAGVWGSESIGIVYSPDVFDYLPEEKRRGVRPNALATLSELLSGYWNKSGPSNDTISILNRQSIAVGDADRLGPRYTFLVGAKNEFVRYRTQNDIYQAMGRSLSSWVTSTTLQDRMDAYVAGNWQAAAVSVPDNMPLKTSDMETPFTAMGSSRVGLGRDRFKDFAAQRLAREAVEVLLNRHEEQRQRGDERSSRAVAQEVADNAFGAFLVRSQLNERGEDKNDILDAFRPTDREEQVRQLKSQVFDQVTSNAPERGRPVPEWRAIISERIREVIDRTLDEFDVANRERGRAWVKSAQRHLQKLAAATLAGEGYVVAALLFRKLADELRAVQTELEQEASRYLRHGDNVEQQVEEALRRAGGEVLPRSHPQVSDAVRRGVAAVHYRGEARLRSLVASVLPDLADNVMLRLAEEIERAGHGLQAESAPAQGQPSRISTWPDGDEVPARLMPAANEFMLEDPGTYPATLRDLIRRSVREEARDTAFRAVVQRIVVGADEVFSDDQRAVGVTSSWTPRLHELHAELSSPTRASFDIAINAASLLDRATQWLAKGGSPAGNYVKEGLNRYLTSDTVDPEVLARRVQRFEERLGAAIDAAQPLVGIKKSVLVAVHGRSDVASETFLTEIPFSAASTAGEVIRRVFESKGIWSAEIAKTFIESDRDHIDAYTVLSEPYEPVVFDSLMLPIAEEWGQRNKSADGREEFWRWRRARALPEFIPVAPGVRKAMVRGWFSATLLGQVRLDEHSASIFVPNTTGGSGIWLDFPSPLLASGLTASHDYLPLILESLPLAFVDVSVEARITPVVPYRRLRELGTSGSGGLEAYESANAEFTAWIDDGRLPMGAPAPKESFAGRADADPEQRQKCMLARCEALAAQYESLFESQRQRQTLTVPRAYELELDISGAFSDLGRVIRDHQPRQAGVDVWN